MSTPRDDLRQELTAIMSARQELSPTEDAYLVELFLDRLDAELDSRIDARIQKKAGQKQKVNRTAIVVVALGVAIPLTALAIPFGPWGLAVIWGTILLIVLVTASD